MKKLLFTLLLLIMFTGLAQSQSFKPNMNLIIRGDYNVWLSDSNWKQTYKGFPGIQLDVVYNINSEWGIVGTFGADFLAPKDKRDTIAFGGDTTKFTWESSPQISGYIGPRYYINLPNNKNLRIYLDAALGLYMYKPGTLKSTSNTNPVTTSSTTFNSVSQFGFNFGVGTNINLSPSVFVNLMVKYHNVLKKSGVVFKEKTTVTQGNVTISETTTFPPENITGRSYVQFGAGIGFTFGL
jgi:opacity protein-like surface antigen